MVLGYSLYEIAAMFFIYGFLGWCVEVIFRGLSEGKFINAGFLNGPICPIYGVGGVIVVLCLTSVSENLPLLFVFSSLLTTALELLAGFALDKLFHTRWWDYNDKPFNLGGYICLQFSVCWGLVCIALMKIIHPPVIQLIRGFPFLLGLLLMVFFGVIFIADIVVTVITINHLTSRLRVMDEIAGSIHSFSDGIGSKVYDGAAAVKNKGEELWESDGAREMREKYNENLTELKARYAEMTAERHRLQNRIIKAFPKMTARSHNEQLEKIKAKIWKK